MAVCTAENAFILCRRNLIWEFTIIYEGCLLQDQYNSVSPMDHNDHNSSDSESDGGLLGW